MRLTKRDLSLLALLCQNAVMSFEQVRLWAFDGRHKATVSNRLSKLEEMAVIRRINVGNFIYKTQMRPVGVVVQITKRGIEVLKANDLFVEKWRTEPIPVNIGSLIHDLELAEAVHGVLEKLPRASIVNGKHLNTDGNGAHSKVPDAILELPPADLDLAKQLRLVAPDTVAKSASVRVGVELELTSKSDRRYREIITGYRLNRGVDRVLYLSHDQAIFRKIQSVITGFAIKGELRPHHGMFSFLQVHRFLSRNVSPAPQECRTPVVQLPLAADAGGAMDSTKEQTQLREVV